MKFIYLMIFGILCSNVFALQEFTVGNNAEIDAIISDHDVNRIAVSGAKITQIKLATNQLKVDTDEQNGQIFVYPIIENHPVVTETRIGSLKAQTITGTMISLFVIDENGNSYNLRLRMQSVPSETIIIKPLSSAKAMAGTDFSTQIVSMTEDMYLDRSDDDGYSITDQNLPIKLWKEVDFELYKTYENEQFKGSVFILRNISNKKIILTEKQFWKPNTIAIGIETPVLEPDQITKIFVIGNKQNE